MKPVLIVTHVQFVANGGIHGPAHALTDYLQRNKYAYWFVQHSLTGQHPSWLDYVAVNGTSERKSIGSSRFWPLPLRAIFEMARTLRIARQCRPELCVAVDPLNALAALVACRLGWVKRVVFYTADYAIDRFNNPFVNHIYHAIDQWCIHTADAVWNVSRRIVERRATQGVPAHRNRFVPNAPALRDIPSAPATRHRHDLIIVANLIASIDYPLIFRVIDQLRHFFPAIRLQVIGDGPRRGELETLVDTMALDQQVFFLGRLDRHDVLSQVSAAAVGLALYTRDCSWTYYGDSKKAREYLACGLPVIITDVVSTADDIAAADAGAVVALTTEALTAAIRKLFSDDGHYQRQQNNARALAQQFDLERILDAELLPQIS